MNLLLIDDNADNLAMTKNLLEKRGYRVRATPSIREGLFLVLDERPDVVILDWVMPDGGGPKFIAELEADLNLARIRVIVTTALPPDGLSALGPVVATLQKPVGIDELVAALEKIGGEFMIGTLIALLIFLVVLVVIVYVVNYVCDLTGQPQPVKTIALLIIGLIALLVLLQHLGALGL